MIFAIWHRWVERGQWWWLAILAAVILVDVFIGTWLLAWELRMLKEAWR